MCNADVGRDYISRAVKTAFNPSFNPVKQFKRTTKESFDTTGQQMAQDQFNADLVAQKNRIRAVNEQTRRDAPANSYIAANGSFTNATQRRKRTSLLTEENNQTLLG